METPFVDAIMTLADQRNFYVSKIIWETLVSPTARLYVGFILTVNVNETLCFQEIKLERQVRFVTNGHI